MGIFSGLFGGDAPPAPANVNAGKAAASYLFGDQFPNYQGGIAGTDFINSVQGAESRSRPGFQALDLEGTRNLLQGVDGQAGLLSQIGRANTTMRQQNLADLQSMGGDTANAIIDGNPYMRGALDRIHDGYTDEYYGSRLAEEMENQALEELQAGGDLTDREAVQSRPHVSHRPHAAACWIIRRSLVSCETTTCFLASARQSVAVTLRVWSIKTPTSEIAQTITT